jgi:hypothetical protein
MIQRVLLPLHAAQLAILLWLAYRGIFCCDAYYYMNLGARLFDAPWPYHDDFAGYRSYFVPLVFWLLQKIPAPALGESHESLPVTLSVVFTLVSYVASLHIARREGIRRYLVFAIPTFFNPFLLGHVVAPLQESVLMLFVTPLIVVLLAVRQRSPLATFAMAVAAASFAFIIRGSMVWIAAPLLVFVALEIRRNRDSWRAAPRGALAAIAVLVPLVLVAPQSWEMQQKYGTLDPYPTRNDIVGMQTFFGISMFKTTTMLHDGKWTQLRALSPFDALPIPQKMKLSWYAENKGPAVFMVLAHVWAGLHYDVLTTYVKFRQFKILNPWIVLSSFVVAYGLLGFGMYWRLEPSRAAMLAAMLALSCLYTAFVGVEARFGLFGFLALSVVAAQLAASPDGRARMRSTLPLALAYVLLCVVFNSVLLYAAPEFKIIPR